MGRTSLGGDLPTSFSAETGAVFSGTRTPGQPRARPLSGVTSGVDLVTHLRQPLPGVSTVFPPFNSALLGTRLLGPARTPARWSVHGNPLATRLFSTQVRPIPYARHCGLPAACLPPWVILLLTLRVLPSGCRGPWARSIAVCVCECVAGCTLPSALRDIESILGVPCPGLTSSFFPRGADSLVGELVARNQGQVLGVLGAGGLSLLPGLRGTWKLDAGKE